MKRYGFFGGSFNPPTIAHERLAEEIEEKFNTMSIQEFFENLENQVEDYYMKG